MVRLPNPFVEQQSPSLRYFLGLVLIAIKLVAGFVVMFLIIGVSIKVAQVLPSHLFALVAVLVILAVAYVRDVIVFNRSKYIRSKGDPRR